ncbi:YeeE/YedE thiosulfate transporter family protein [Sulfurimonas sp.]|nr:YeeE/YedE thiosulfate transporter family protein [Sulfurimonas sp.]
MSVELIEGLIIGIIFGFFLQRARVDKYDVQIGAMLLEDMTIFKFMLPAIIVAIIGIYTMYDLGMVTLDIKPTILGVNILGGIIFGIGWAIFGLCPGTAGGALGEGAWDALFGIAGMFVGAALFAYLFPYINIYLINLGDYGRISLADVLGISHWIVAAVFISVAITMLIFFEKKGL